MKFNRVRIARISLAIGVMSLSVSANAEVFKCVGPDAKISLQQTPCAAAQVENKTSAEGGSRWEILTRTAEGNATWLLSIDTSRITNEGPYKRIILRRELEDNGKITTSTVSEELFDCTGLRSKLLSVNGEPRKTPDWSELKNNGRTRILGERIQAKACTG